MEQAKDGGARYRALGAMSGTSLDGVDAAIIETDGFDIFAFGAHRYRLYRDPEQHILRQALGCWTGPAVEAAAGVVTEAHIEALADLHCDVIGFHGQTLAHAPRAQGTLQVGDGKALAAALSQVVVWDFRSDDVAMGGEGAPLAPFFHFACAHWIGATEPLAFLNLGGVGNITFVDPTALTPETPGALLAFDTGPANAPINDLMKARLGLSMDEGGHLASQGTVEEGALELFLAEPYFARVPPKSLDRNDFAETIWLVRELSNADAAATLTAMSAAGVVQALEHCPSPPGRILVTGGGRKNPVMMRMLEAGLECPVVPVERVGLDGDMLEAQAFGYLAVRVLKGLPTSCPSTTGVQAAVGGGIVSRPDDAGSLR